MKDDVELETHHLQDTHHMEKRQCFCGPLRVPCSCAGRKKRVANTDAVELVTHHLEKRQCLCVPGPLSHRNPCCIGRKRRAANMERKTHHLEKRQCLCGPMRVPCACAGRKKRSANTGMKDAVDLEIHRLKKGQCDCVRSPLRIPNPCCRLLKKRGVNTELIDNAQHEVHQLEKRQCTCGPWRVPCKCAGRK
uniref:Uncharacterized protein n=1 Tax=Meloidogyne incognita TaxID=6306 RepID=A0A914KS94_MELIC